MFTWNFQYVSKARLADIFSQLTLNIQKGDVLIRIHTAIHREEEAVELAKFVKGLVPRAQIFGTSASAVINGGRLDSNQCVISVSQMDEGRIRSAFLPTVDEASGAPLAPECLCEMLRKAVDSENPRLMLTFMTGSYMDVKTFVEKCNDVFPGVQMVGGIADAIYSRNRQSGGRGFLFNETGWSRDGILAAMLSGESLECYTSGATGVQTAGDEMVITEAEHNRIISIDGRDALSEYLLGNADELMKRPELADLFPFVYSEHRNVPLQLKAVDGQLIASHNVVPGKKIRRGFIYDGQIVEDGRELFRHVETFEKAETVFAYSCATRYARYPNSVKWELSAYENSNACGCITDGEFTCFEGRNVFANGTFAVSVFGERQYTQEFNPYALSHSEAVTNDNKELIDHLMLLEKKLAEDGAHTATEEFKAFLRECEGRLFYSEADGAANAAAMLMDIKLKGIDRICEINVLDVVSLKLIFSEQMIQLTYHNFLEKCKAFAKEKNYSFYVLGQWYVAIGAPSYATSLEGFENNMKSLHRELFETSEEYVAIVPLFCVMYNCTAENISSTYVSARVEMMNKNMQFLVRDASEQRLDEESIRKKYQMVNLIHYAISHDTLTPYYQGIYDNKKQRIHHYEALMRLRDEEGNVYLPKDFLGVARSFGLLYDSLSLIMIRKVFERFQDEEDKAVSINIGIRDIQNPEILDYIYDTLSTMKHPENFIFEFLENEDVEDYNDLVTFVDKIHELGGLISIDDFGNGYSNLQHILSIHSDFIKIDGSIVRNCCVDKESENLVALITGWKSLSARNVKIIAEFVENEEIQKMMEIYNIDFSQGYLFSKPSSEI
jgi:EAL domain-containing protein (putative c-di-GMP-specific phosphodiesterase class I)